MTKTKITVLKGKVDAVAYVAKSGYPVVGSFEDEKSLQKFYKQLPIDVLEGWAASLKAEYKGCSTSEPIHRMRVCMAILYSFFPKQTTSSPKQESPYKKFTTEELINLCIGNDVCVEVTDDMRIMRMRCIMALRASKVIE